MAQERPVATVGGLVRFLPEAFPPHLLMVRKPLRTLRQRVSDTGLLPSAQRASRTPTVLAGACHLAGLDNELCPLPWPPSVFRGPTTFAPLPRSGLCFCEGLRVVPMSLCKPSLPGLFSPCFLSALIPTPFSQSLSLPICEMRPLDWVLGDSETLEGFGEVLDAWAVPWHQPRP